MNKRGYNRPVDDGHFVRKLFLLHRHHQKFLALALKLFSIGQNQKRIGKVKQLQFAIATAASSFPKHVKIGGPIIWRGGGLWVRVQKLNSERLEKAINTLKAIK